MKLWIVAVIAAASTVPLAPIADAPDEEVLRERLRELFMKDPQRDFAQCAPSDGEQRRFAASEQLPLVEIAIGDSLDRLVERFPEYFPFYRPGSMIEPSDQMMRLSLDIGGERIVSKTGGMHNVATFVGANFRLGQIYSIEFYDQQCPLSLSEAMVRARALEAKLVAAGFEREPALIAAEDYGALSSDRLPGWEEGELALSETPRRYAFVSSRWIRGAQTAAVSIWNWGAAKSEPIFGQMQAVSPLSGSIFELDGTGRKYGIQFRLSDEALYETPFEQPSDTGLTARRPVR